MTLTIAVPVDTPVIFPLLSTLTTFELLLDQISFLFVAFDGLIVAINVSDLSFSSPVLLLFNSILVIQGIANREGNTGGDTQGAVSLRNGYLDSEKRAELSEPSFKKAEKQFLRILLYKLSVDKQTTLKVSDIELSLPLPSYTINTLRTLSTWPQSL